MTLVSLPMPDGRALEFEVRPDPSKLIFFALGVRKSGSSLMNMILTDLSEANHCPRVDVPAKAFAAGYRVADWATNRRLPNILRRGNLYAGFRAAPVVLFGRPAWRDARKILLVRDPRDALVSEYFSAAFSHQLPQANGETSVIAKLRETALDSAIEDYVLSRVAPLNRTIDEYLPILDDPLLRLFRYEDVVFEKARWMRDIADHFGWTVDQPLIDHVLSIHDRVPDVEAPTAFIRKVTPGDHRDKLSAEVIARIDHALSPTWAKLGY